MVREDNLDQRDRHSLQRLLEDYKKLSENTFWHEFLEYVRKESVDALRQCAVESFPNDKIRHWQGKFKALEQVYKTFPDNLLDEINREIDK